MRLMHRSSSHRWSRWTLNRAPWVLCGWILLTVVIRIAAPSWSDVAYDGDFEYLPDEMSSVAGGHLLDDAFPGDRSRSQIVLVLARDNAKFTKTTKLSAESHRQPIRSETRRIADSLVNISVVGRPMIRLDSHSPVCATHSISRRTHARLKSRNDADAIE